MFQIYFLNKHRKDYLRDQGLSGPILVIGRHIW